MNPPSVYDVTTPRSQRTNNTTRIVQSILFQSHKRPMSTALVAHREIAFVISRITHPRRTETVGLST
jgi:hypothetical protein